MTSIRPFIHHKIVVLHEDATIQAVARAMCDQAIGCVVIADHKGHFTGIVTDRDLTCTVVADSTDKDCLVSQVMTSPIVTAEENLELEQVIGLMMAHGIRRIPIVHSFPGGAQKCIGLVTLDDLIASRSIDEYPLIRIVKSQLLRRVRQYQKRSAVLHLTEYPDPKFPDKISVEVFYNQVAKQARLQKYKVNSEQSNEMIQLVLEAVVKRLHHTGAIHFIAQLPLSLQNELLSIATGPDRTITTAKVLGDFQTRFGIDLDAACRILTGICKSLDQILNPKYFAHVKDQLPEDFRTLFHFQENKAA